MTTNEPTQRPATEGERCDCGAPARIVFQTEHYGDVPYCGVPHDGSEAEALTLAEYLDRGGDPSQLKGYGNMVDMLVDMLVDMATGEVTEEYRREHVAMLRWEPFGTDYDGPVGAWESAAEYRAFNERCIELVESDSLRERFLAAMPPADRADFDERVWQFQQPMHRADLEYGAADTCSTCNGTIGPDDEYVRIRERFEEPSGDDVIMCVYCIRAVEVPALEPAPN